MRQIATALSADRPPVRAGSVPIGSERGWWRPMPRQDARRLVLAARRYELTTRALGHIALEIIDLLSNLQDPRTGRLDPSLRWLMARLRRSRDAVCRALARLKAHGFLDWMRRVKPTGCTSKGPQIRQTSNAYRLSMPPRAARLIQAPPPLPHIDRPEPVRVPSILDLALSAFAAARQRESGPRSQDETTS